jgi:hypothetical protein
MQQCIGATRLHWIMAVDSMVALVTGSMNTGCWVRSGSSKLISMTF